jgi:hypothetical protein
MSICDNLVHPFQSDPGTSQQQRIIDALLANAPAIDGRKMADLLDYFVQLSTHINYYDEQLNIGDWRPFFQKSVPFTLATLIKYNKDSVSNKFELYNKLFDTHPSKQSLQLLLHFIFHYSINKINTWHAQLKTSDLPVTILMEQLIKDKLQGPLKSFIQYHNTAVKWYKVKRIDFRNLQANEVWGLSEQDLQRVDENFISTGKSKRSRLIALRNNAKPLQSSFLDAIQVFSNSSESNIEQSLFPLKEELKKLHTPHLGLLFAFLKLFQHLQSDLNGYTRKHLDYFYRDVLKLKPREAVADKAHIVFEIQNQLDKYLLKKGLLVKDGKDAKKAEILFSLDDEIVVNKAEVAEVRTLFLDQGSEGNIDFVKGVYIAPDARKADGIKIDFKDSDPRNFPTLGARFSKYQDPEQKFTKPYPAARLGFILASPVLLLNEGYRTVDINLACKLNEICNEASGAEAGRARNCCEGTNTLAILANDPCRPDQSKLLEAAKLFESVKNILNVKFYYVSKDLIAQAIKKGIASATIKKLFDILKVNHAKICYCPTEEIKYDTLLTVPAFEGRFGADELKIVNEIFKPQYPLKILFSGEKSWVEPDLTDASGNPYDPFVFTSLDTVTGRFNFGIKSILKSDKPAVSFYNKEKLKEDFGTEQPLVKIELNDFIKRQFTKTEFESLVNKAGSSSDRCCLLGTAFEDDYIVSLYHFFRNIVVEDTATDKTTIKVTVCGLKNFIVQNDESVQDVNAPIYPFGTRPEIVDFDVVNPAKPPLTNPNLIGPNFYIGSKEVFCKKWDAVRINLNWKDKPSNFREYYKAYVVEDVALQIFGLDENKFKIRLSSLLDGKWSEQAADRKLFDISAPAVFPPLNAADTLACAPDGSFKQAILLTPANFPGQFNQPFAIGNGVNASLDVNTRNGFVRINLREQDFLHKDYSFVLARQMMALGRYPDVLIEGAVYKKDGNTVIVFRSLGKTIVELKDEIKDSRNAAQDAKDKVDDLNTSFDAAIDWPPPLSSISNAERNALIPLVHDSKTLADASLQQAEDTKLKLDDLQSLIDIFDVITGEIVKPLTVLIPNEPWTPIIKNMALDYTATATVTDIDLIHLYPFEQTYKAEEIQLKPTLFPTFCDEGNLFIGLKKLTPGSNVAILFQLAEATADSESEREEIKWYYLDNNQWKELRKGFEVLNDDTNGLTTSGIVKFLMPANMTNENTILPKGLHWIRASIAKNSKAISETIGIHAQAARVSFTNEEANDKMRLAEPLPASSIAKLKEADTAVKKLTQHYDSFDGRIPEIEGQFYIRVSELLRHKGRAIQKFDYERIVLEAFPQIFKAKCINHSYGLNAHKFRHDFPMAPGYVLLAVIPDLNKMIAGRSFEPRVPVSLLEKIFDYLCKRTSPFVRLKIMNPRYENVHFCIKVKLYPGKDEVFYKEKLEQDLREFLAPWAVGEYDKLSFGQCVNRSDIVQFLETRDYVDYILELSMADDKNNLPSAKNIIQVCPKTPRSILIAGEIDVCIKQNDCEKWSEGEACANPATALVDYCGNNDTIIT